MNRVTQRSFRERQVAIADVRKYDEPIPASELWDFFGRLYSSEGRHPDRKKRIRFYTEDHDIFPVKTGFHSALGSWVAHYNILADSLDLTSANWGATDATVAKSTYSYDGYYFFSLTLTDTNGYVQQVFDADEIPLPDSELK
jgi:hypothetical protein